MSQISSGANPYAHRISSVVFVKKAEPWQDGWYLWLTHEEGESILSIRTRGGTAFAVGHCLTLSYFPDDQFSGLCITHRNAIHLHDKLEVDVLGVLSPSTPPTPEPVLKEHPMNTGITIFNFEQSAIRTLIDEQGEPWFVGKDVAEVLGYKDTTNAIKQHCKGVVKHHPLQTPGGMQEVRVISEPDVLRLVVKSNLPEAEKFECWVFEEVLPAIRKTGKFETQPFDLADPAFLRSTLLTYTEKVIALEAKVQEQAPKVAALERLEGAEGSVCITDAAKLLKIRPKDCFSHLSAHRYIFRRHNGGAWLGYQDKIQAGLLEMKVDTVTRQDGSEKIVERVLITPKGLSAVAKMMGISIQ